MFNFKIDFLNRDVSVDEKNKVTIEIEIKSLGDCLVNKIIFQCGEKEVGVIENPMGITCGKRWIDFDFSGLNNGSNKITASAFNSEEKNNAISKLKAVTLNIKGITNTRMLPVLEVDKITPTITSELFPLIHLSLRSLIKFEYQSKSFEQFGINDQIIKLLVKINGELVEQIESIGAKQVDVVPRNSLVAGKNEITLIADYKAFPGIEAQVSRSIYLNDKAPRVRFDQELQYSNSLSPLLDVAFLPTLAGIDPHSCSLQSGESDIPCEIFISDQPKNPEWINVAKIQIKEPLWQGHHQLKFKIADRTGLVSDWAECSLIIDTVPPKVVSISPGSGEVIDSNNRSLDVFFSDQAKTALSKRAVHDLLGIGCDVSASFDTQGVHYISQLAEADPDQFSGFISDLETDRAIEKARLITRINLDSSMIQNINYWKIESFLEMPTETMAEISELDIDQIEKIKNQLSPLIFILDYNAFKQLHLGDCSLYAGSGIETIKISIDGEPFTGSSNFAADKLNFLLPDDLSEGHHLIRLEFFDRCKNQGIYEYSILLDNSAPELEMLFPSAGDSLNDQNLVIHGLYKDKLSGIDPNSVKLVVDGNDVTDRTVITESGFSYSCLEPAEGKHCYTILVADLAGNYSEQQIDFTYDKTVPLVELDSAMDRVATALKRCKISGKVREKNLTLRYLKNQITIENDLSFSAEIPLKQGWNRIEMQVWDQAGNRGKSNRVMIYRIGKGETALFGKVIDSNDMPVSDAMVRSLSSPCYARTDARGKFCLCQQSIRFGMHRFEVSSPRISRNKMQKRVVSLNIQYERVYNLGELFLLESKLDSGTTISTNPGRTTIQEPNRKAELLLGNEAVRFPEGDESRKIAVSLVERKHVPSLNVNNMLMGDVYSLEPSGTVMEAEAKLSLDNTFNLPPHTQVPILSYNERAGHWFLTSFGRVEADGAKISTLPNHGIRHFSLVTAVMPNVKIETYRDDIHVPAADALKGGVTFDIALPAFKASGQVVLPALNYNSLAAHPMVSLNSVFLGLETVKEVTELPSVTLTDSMTLNKTDIHTKATGYRNSKFWEVWEDDEVKTGEEEFDSTVYLPVDQNPYQQLPDSQECDNDQWLEFSYDIISTPVEIFKLIQTTSSDITQYLWPRAISTKSYLGYLETPWRKLLGEQKDWIDGDQILSGRKLPPDCTIRHHIEPRFENGQFYPTGLYNYINKFSLEYEGLRCLNTSSATDGFSVDEDFLHYLFVERQKLLNTEPRTDEQEEQLTELENTITHFNELQQIYNEHIVTTSTETSCIDPMDALHRNEAGRCVVVNAINSSFGQGWQFKGVQKLIPVGHQRVLVTHGDEKLVFSSEGNRIENLHSSELSLVTLAEDDESLIGVSGNRIVRMNLEDGTSSVLHEETARYNSMQSTTYLQVWEDSAISAIDSETNTPQYSRTFHWKQESKIDKHQISEVPPPEYSDIAVDQAGNVYVAEKNRHRIRKLQKDGTHQTMCGFFYLDRETQVNESICGYDAGDPVIKKVVTVTWTWKTRTDPTPDGEQARGASIHTPTGLLVDMDQNLVFSEWGNHRIRKIDSKTGVLSTIAGNGTREFSYDAVIAKQAAIPRPQRICQDQYGNILCTIQYIRRPRRHLGETKALNTILLMRVDTNGGLSHVAGNPVGTINTGIDARMHKLVNVSDMVVDGLNRIFLYSENKIIQIDKNGFVDDYAGGCSDPIVLDAEGPALNVAIAQEGHMVCLENGALLLTDPQQGIVRKIVNTFMARGNLTFRGPLGYAFSKIRVLPDGTWDRDYQDGRRVHFNQNGELLYEESPAGERTQYEYQNHRLTRIAYPKGQFIEFRYDSAGKIKEIADHIGRTTRFTVNGGKLTMINHADGHQHEFGYLADGRMNFQKEL